ncbi:MFS transporter [Ktedonosporobacter rubrisoli]|uniref:MFS transporter n=1 Tax=Ktedonosporobacter rubrisoli TaxID=2509675 RepID=A0A4P6K530_KTERU|nr:MFS transporter [Ktedonosporobacter rubrisoli]QBD83082.1 MFS transporter [Ktedonosporobacter rubrisoli]
MDHSSNSGVAQFITVLNFQSVTLVLPAIQHSLGFSAENLQWVVSANALAFGGGLLVAGRLADIFGHRRIFVCGLLLSTISASGCGLATSQFMLVFARILQGMATALMIPAALALIIDLSPQGTLRYRALGAWGFLVRLGRGRNVAR